MIQLMLNGRLYEVEEKYLKPVEPMEVIDVEFEEVKLEEVADV